MPVGRPCGAPSRGAGYQVSSTVPAVVTVAMPTAVAPDGEAVAVVTVGHATEAARTAGGP
ncbi:hypothetical protein GCM10027300_33130 [Modestobacter lapidis]